MMAERLTVALAGNPNSGKTTIFNNLTGLRHHVGNYPGVTIEKKEGTVRRGDVEIRVVDLPGTYSLTAYSIEEVVTRNFIIDEKPDVVVDILDVSNIERNLYLAVQFMELGVPLVLAFNMSDVARARGLEFDLETLSRLLGVAIVPTVGHKRRGMEELLDAVVTVAAAEEPSRPAVIHYGREIEEEIQRLRRLIETDGALTPHYDPRWLAVKLLENDREIREKVTSTKLLDAVDRSIEHLRHVFRDNPELVIAGCRYGFISGACQESVRSTVEARHTRSDKIDAVLTHPLAGLPIFLVLMYLVFQLTFTVGEPLMKGVEYVKNWLAAGVAGFWPEGSESAFQSLLVDGIIQGVGNVIIFLPNILLLFFAIAVLEDSGYMARAAFIMDRYMHRIGLHGKSFIPMLIGFGCTVPAIMATRTLENRRDRITTMLVLPLMSCGARFPIYALIIPAFFPLGWRTPIMWIIYVIGILLALAAARVLRSTILKGESEGLVLELPPYRVPTLRGLLIHMWERGWHYVKKAGTLILGISIIMWALTSYPKPSKEDLAGLGGNEAARVKLEHSTVGRIGKGIEPVLRPMGFDWKIGTALVGAFAAKEVFVAQMGIIYAMGEGEDTADALRRDLRRDYTPLAAFCVMLWCLISTPCLATCAVTGSEGGWKWALAQLIGLTVLAYVVTIIVYQLGSLLGIGVT